MRPYSDIVRWVIAFAAFSVAACTSIESGGESTSITGDARYAEKLVGTWSAEYFFEERKFRTYGEKTYFANGTASGFMQHQELTGDGTYIEAGRETYTSNWRIENSVVIITNIRFDPIEKMTGETLRDRIISIDDHAAEFEELSSGERFTRKRVE